MVLASHVMTVVKGKNETPMKQHTTMLGYTAKRLQQ
jgi:hypothetical protein